MQITSTAFWIAAGSVGHMLIILASVGSISDKRWQSMFSIHSPDTPNELLFSLSSFVGLHLRKQIKGFESPSLRFPSDEARSLLVASFSLYRFVFFSNGRLGTDQKISQLATI